MRATKNRPQKNPKPRLVEIEIKGLGFLGDGHGMLDGVDVMVPLTLPGERWSVALEGKTGGHWRGRAIEPIAPLNREPAICQHFGECGGCSLQHLETQIYDQLKRERIQKALRHREVAHPELKATIKCPHGSRRRLRLAFDGQGALGLRMRGRKQVVDLKECPITVDGIVNQLPSIRQWTRKLGGIGEVSVTATANGIDLLVTSNERPGEARLDEAREFGWLRLAYAQTLEDHPEILMLSSEPVIRLGQTDIGLPSGAFLQATTEGETALQSFALHHLNGPKRVADYFCGLGTLSLACSHAGHDVQAFDQFEPSVRMLRATGKVVRAEVMDLIRHPPHTNELRRLDAAILDPPRAGAQTLCDTIASSKLGSIIYASCDPKSFAKDAAILQSAGFTLEELQPIDQFLYSAEIELIAAFKR